MTRYDSLLFDFDGTVVNSNDAVLSAWQHTYKVLRGEEGDLDWIRSTFGEQLDISLARAFPEVPSEESVYIYKSYQITRLRDLVKPYPGVLEVIEELKAKGVPLALVTSRHKETADIMFDMFRINELFDVIIVSEDTVNHKPDPEPVVKALDCLGMPAETSLMVGDSAYDMLTAHNAGAKFALVDWTTTMEIVRDDDGTPVTTKSGLTDEQPEEIIDRPEDIISCCRF